MRRPVRPQTYLVALLVAALCLLAACRTGTSVGVRPEFKKASVQTVVIVPFYQLSSFGASAESQKLTREAYELRTERWLKANGFDVVTPREFEQALTERGAWQTYQDGVILRDSLEVYFEPSAEDAVNAAAEVIALQELAANGALPEGRLLFGEIIYQSEATCRTSVSPRDRFSSMEVHPEAKDTLPPRPCVLSHFQAKLVDPTTGSTMWYNRHLLELQVAALDTDAVLTAIERVIDAVFGTKRGLLSLQ